MISRELLLAILQGLPRKYFNILEPPWIGMALRIDANLLQGQSPLQALQNAYQDMGPHGRKRLRQTLQQVLPVMQLPGLTYRQREILIVLRSLKCASLSQVCAILTHDRRNTHHRLNALVAKGHAVRIHQPNGIHYMAIQKPLGREVKQGINDFIQDLIHEAMTPEPSAEPHASALDNEEERERLPTSGLHQLDPANTGAPALWANLSGPTQPTHSPSSTHSAPPTPRRRHTRFFWN